MQYYERSPAVKAWDELREAARLYAARYLQDMHAGVDYTAEENRLQAAALAFFNVQKKRRVTPRATDKKGGKSQ